MICIITIFIAIGNQTTASCSYASQQFLARTRALGVLPATTMAWRASSVPATTMAWRASSEKNRWHSHSLPEWEEWIDGMAENGVGGYNKQSWKEWVDSMLRKHGAPHLWLEPAQGPPAQGQEPPAEVPPELEDMSDLEPDLEEVAKHPWGRVYRLCMRYPTRPPPGMTDEKATKFISILRLINRVMNPNGFPEDVWFEDEKSVWFQRHVALSRWRDSASSSSGGPPAQGPPAQGPLEHIRAR